MMERLKRIARFDIGSMFIYDPTRPPGARLELKDLTQIDTSCLKRIRVSVDNGGVSHCELDTYNALDAIKLYRDTLLATTGGNLRGKKVTVTIGLTEGIPPARNEPIVVNPNGL